MENNPNRRDFLKLTLSGAASTALAGGALNLAAVSSAVAATLSEYSQALPIPAKKDAATGVARTASMHSD